MFESVVISVVFIVVVSVLAGIAGYEMWRSKHAQEEGAKATWQLLQHLAEMQRQQALDLIINGPKDAPIPSDPRERIVEYLNRLEPHHPFTHYAMNLVEALDEANLTWFESLSEADREVLAELFADPPAGFEFPDQPVSDILVRWATREPDQFERLIRNRIVRMPIGIRLVVVESCLLANNPSLKRVIEPALSNLESQDACRELLGSLTVASDFEIRRSLIDTVVSHIPAEWASAKEYALELREQSAAGFNSA